MDECHVEKIYLTAEIKLSKQNNPSSSSRLQQHHQHTSLTTIFKEIFNVKLKTVGQRGIKMDIRKRETGKIDKVGG
jgi:D-ribose pyranose/furanose isomerase RbsD